MTTTLLTGVRFLSGRVETGNQLGRMIGFPTANLTVPSELYPSQGVYGVYVYRGFKQYLGLMNVGKRPTIRDGEHQTIEVHILNFNEEIYGETLVVEIVFPIREERKFPSIDALKAQLQKDVVFAKNAFKDIQKNLTKVSKFA